MKAVKNNVVTTSNVFKEFASTLLIGHGFSTEKLNYFLILVVFEVLFVEATHFFWIIAVLRGFPWKNRRTYLIISFFN